MRLEKVEGTRAKLGRMFLGNKSGFTVRDGFDYWPEMVERAVEGNSEPFLGGMDEIRKPEEETKKPEDEMSRPEEEESAEFDAIVEELGYDFEVVG